MSRHACRHTRWNLRGRGTWFVCSPCVYVEACMQAHTVEPARPRNMVRVLSLCLCRGMHAGTHGGTCEAEEHGSCALPVSMSMHACRHTRWNLRGRGTWFVCSPCVYVDACMQ